MRNYIREMSSSKTVHRTSMVLSGKNHRYIRWNSVPGPDGVIFLCNTCKCRNCHWSKLLKVSFTVFGEGMLSFSRMFHLQRVWFQKCLCKKQPHGFFHQLTPWVFLKNWNCIFRTPFESITSSLPKPTLAYRKGVRKATESTALIY